MICCLGRDGWGSIKLVLKLIYFHEICQIWEAKFTQMPGPICSTNINPNIIGACSRYYVVCILQSLFSNCQKQPELWVNVSVLESRFNAAQGSSAYLASSSGMPQRAKSKWFISNNAPRTGTYFMSGKVADVFDISGKSDKASFLSSNSW